ncbi:MAG TPA: TetR/AcrR family transcriptional regulator [Candidatus Dormibacteraeota bacterium]
MISKQPQRSRRLSGEARRSELLSSARQVFGSAGYHSTTTREIASAAGVSEALLYQHFPGKRQLFEAVIQEAAADLEARLCAAGDAADPLGAALEGYFEFVEQEAPLFLVFFRQALQADPAFEHLYRELNQRFLELCEGSLGRLGDLAPERQEVVAHALGGMVTELALWWVESGRLDRRQIVEHAARMGRAIYESEVGDGS